MSTFDCEDISAHERRKGKKQHTKVAILFPLTMFVLLYVLISIQSLNSFVWIPSDENEAFLAVACSDGRIHIISVAHSRVIRVLEGLR